MEYISKYTQPFTLEEASGFDVPVITEEIARLENSLQHLRDTQTQLKEIASQMEIEDEEITKALAENEVVIGSQEERISILKMALADKGINLGPHYQPAVPTAPHTESTTIAGHGTTTSAIPSAEAGVVEPTTEPEDGSVYL